MGKVQILAVLTMDGCLSSELYDKAHQDCKYQLKNAPYTN